MKRDHFQGKILVFAGPVGSGKSTQIGLLASELRKRGIRVKTTRLKTNHLLARLFTSFVKRVLGGKSDDFSSVRWLFERRPVLFKKLFRFLFTVDVLCIAVIFFLAVYLPMKRGYTVIVEEYIPSTISSYVYLSKGLNVSLKSLSPMFNFLLGLVSLAKPSLVIFLDSTNKDLKMRWRERGSPVERLDYLRMQRTTLLSLLEDFISIKEMILIDTNNQTPRQTYDVIKEHLRHSTHVQVGL